MVISPLTPNERKEVSARSDPVGDRYYKPLRIVDVAADILFWIAAALSFAAIFIDKEKNNSAYSYVNIIFVLVVIILFFAGVVSKLYLSPRADDQRRKDLFTNSFGINLTHETTTGYYNNDETNSFRRLSLSVMESAFFTSRISQKMLLSTRILTSSYILIWLYCALVRESDLGFLATAAQALFSEILISKWLRLEWLRWRSEEVFSQLQRLLNNARSFNNELTRAQAVELVSYYETSKANAGIVLSNRIFQELNPSLSAEWLAILKTIPSHTVAPKIRTL